MADTKQSFDADTVVQYLITQQANLGVYLALFRKYTAGLLDARTVVERLRADVVNKPHYQKFLTIGGLYHG